MYIIVYFVHKQGQLSTKQEHSCHLMLKKTKQKKTKKWKQANQMKVIGYVINKKQENIRMLSFRKRETNKKNRKWKREKKFKRKRYITVKKQKYQIRCFNVLENKRQRNENIK